MIDEHQNALRIAVIDEQISGLREQSRAHAVTTKEQFDKVFHKLEEIADHVAEIQTSAKIGWKTLVAIGSFVAGVVGIAASIMGYFRG